MKMQKPVIIEYQALMRQFFFANTLFLIFSCSQNNPQQATAEKKDTLKPPVMIAVKNPIVVHLDTCPPPLTITIPAKAKDSFVLKTNNSKTVIHSPEIKPADFSVMMQNYNTEQGLGNSTVRGSCLDKSGNLWFATYGGGISRYDGKEFRNFTATHGLINNLVNTIIEDTERNLWIGTFGGVSRYNGRFFTNYTIAQGLVNNYTNSIFQDKTGNLWFGTGGGVSCYDGKVFKSYTTTDGLISNWVTSILQDKSGNFWFGTAGGVSYYDGKTFRNYTTAEGLANNYVSSIFEDKNGSLWFGTGWGICRLDKNGSFKSYKAPAELANNTILIIKEDNKGAFWFGTMEGVFGLKEDGSIMNLNTNRGLINNNVRSIVEDKAGNLWFCTENGISRFDKDGKFFIGYTTAQGLTSNSVWSVCEDRKENIWFGTYNQFGNKGGVSCLNRERKTFTNYTTAQGLSNNAVRDIAEDKSGNLWFATEGGGACQLDSARKVWKVYTTLQGLPENGLRWVTEDKKGNLWFATGDNGVCCLDQNKRTITTFTTAQGLSSNQVRCIIEDKAGNLWFTVLGSGISRLDKERKYFTNYTTAQGLANNFVYSMLEDKHGNLWICTTVGISRYDGKSFANYNSADGLPDDEVRAIVMDKEGTLWFGANKGFTALKGFARDVKPSSETLDEVQLKPSNEFSNAELVNRNYKPVFEIYNKKTGYQGKGVNNQAMGVTHEGAIWAGTGLFMGDRLIRFDFNGVHKNPNPSEVFIQSIKINNEAISWYDLTADSYLNSKEELIDSITTDPNITEEGIVLEKILSEEQRQAMREKFSAVKFDSITRFYPLPVNLVLPYQHNSITFDFAAIEPARPYLVRYQYMLEGYDKDWNPITDQTTASFGNIHEGSYTFKLKAQSPDGVWSKPLTYTFKVLPPWHRTWWAYTLYILAFLIALWSFIKWRVRTLKKEKILLEDKVTKRTHELQEEKEKVESTLSELKSTQAQLIQSEKMASLGELTAGIAHEIQNPLNFVNNFSEVNKELIGEMREEIKKGNYEEVNALAKDVEDNEEKILHHGKRADAIVKGMLQHSRSSTGVKEPTDINALADEYLRLAYHGLRAKDKSFNATMKTDFDESIGNINIIPQDIGRVILNLINNAFYAVDEKKKQNPNGFEPIVSVSTKKINDKVEIKVADNGNGIPQKVLDKIFQPFFTTKPTGQGTGLGLSLSYDIVKAHGGELKVETKEGEGSEFIILLPC
jgi:ligand-binding sensor domain-containing protein/signal transduction histidine kinase